MNAQHPFAGNPLDRAERERRDEAWIHRAETAAGSRFLPFRDLEVLIDDCLRPRLGWLHTQRIRTFATGAKPIFLGLMDAVAHFAVDMSPFPEAAARVADGRGWRFEDCRTAGTPPPTVACSGSRTVAFRGCACTPPWPVSSIRGKRSRRWWRAK